MLYLLYELQCTALYCMTSFTNHLKYSEIIVYHFDTTSTLKPISLRLFTFEI